MRNLHLFGSQFLLSLSGHRRSKGSFLDKKELEEGLPMKERRHKRVAHYMRNEDLFSKDIVIFPCCLDSPKHWFMVTLVPG